MTARDVEGLIAKTFKAAEAEDLPSGAVRGGRKAASAS